MSRLIDDEGSPDQIARLVELVDFAYSLSKKAKKHKANLKGDNYYGNKLASIRSDAANMFAKLNLASVGDASTVAELINSVFGAAEQLKERLEAARELQHLLRTIKPDVIKTSSDTVVGLFPMSILASTSRSYLTSLGRQMNGCYETGWYDACAVMMRRLVEIAIIEAFEAKLIANEIKDGNGNYLQLTDLVSKALACTKWNLSRNSKNALPRLKTLGHQSAHGRYFNAQKSDVDKVAEDYRVILEEFLHHGGLI